MPGDTDVIRMQCGDGHIRICTSNMCFPIPTRVCDIDDLVGARP